jgi:uncharacterized protein YjeT (DUF2065 family)
VIPSLVLAVALVLIVEGLVLALAPSRVEDALKLIASIPPETRRVLGFGAVVLGVLLLAIARSLGA